MLKRKWLCSLVALTLLPTCMMAKPVKNEKPHKNEVVKVVECSNSLTTDEETVKVQGKKNKSNWAKDEYAKVIELGFLTKQEATDHNSIAYYSDIMGGISKVLEPYGLGDFPSLMIQRPGLREDVVNTIYNQIGTKIPTNKMAVYMDWLDKKEIGNSTELAFCLGLGIIKGYNDNTVNMQGEVTLGELSAMLLRLNNIMENSTVN